MSDNTYYTVRLMNYGKRKIEVIKSVRRCCDLGLREAKELVEATDARGPQVIWEGYDGEQARSRVADLERAGAEVRLETNGVRFVCAVVTAHPDRYLAVGYSGDEGQEHADHLRELVEFALNDFRPNNERRRVSWFEGTAPLPTQDSIIELQIDQVRADGLEPSAIRGTVTKLREQFSGMLVDIDEVADILLAELDLDGGDSSGD